MSSYFNPHEREARDFLAVEWPLKFEYFNPHEREARDNEKKQHGILPILF